MKNAKAHKLFEQAVQAFDGGNAKQAEQKFRRLLPILPGDVQALQYLSAALFQQNKFTEALTYCREAMRLDGANPSIRFNLAQCLASAGEHSQAAEHYAQYLQAEPNDARALTHLGASLAALSRLDEALLTFDKALAIAPQFAGALNNRGIVLIALERFDQACECLRAAVQADPYFSQAWLNLSRASYAIGAYEQAFRAATQGLEAAPDHAALRHWQAELSLAQGHFQPAWSAYVRKWSMSPEFHGKRLWTGEQDLNGKTLLLVTGTVGFGDVIQFCRYIPLVVERGANVIVQTQRELLPLIAAMPGVAQVTALEKHFPPHDYYSHIFFGMPLAFQTRRDTLPVRAPYLQADPALMAAWQGKLVGGQRPKIGLAWTAGHDGARQRSIPLAQLAALLEADADFYVLQRDILPAEQALLAELSATGRLHDTSAQLQNFASTAALIASLDLVISCDTACAHLAGALNAPVWVLLMTGACWRWFLAGDSSEWYPSARLFRQTRRGDWAPVIAEVKFALAQHLAVSAEG